MATDQPSTDHDPDTPRSEIRPDLDPIRARADGTVSERLRAREDVHVLLAEVERLQVEVWRLEGLLEFAYKMRDALAEAAVGARSTESRGWTPLDGDGLEIPEGEPKSLDERIVETVSGWDE